MPINLIIGNRRLWTPGFELNAAFAYHDDNGPPTLMVRFGSDAQWVPSIDPRTWEAPRCNNMQQQQQQRQPPVEQQPAPATDDQPWAGGHAPSDDDGDTLVTLGVPDPRRTSTKDILVADWVTVEERARLLELLEPYESLCVYGKKEDDPPGVPQLDPSLVELRVDLENGFRPSDIYSGMRRYSDEQHEVLARELERFQEAGIVSRTPSSSCSRNFPVLAPKKTPGQWRVTVDMRKLNRATIPNRYPMPLVSTVVEFGAGFVTRTVMDAAEAYWQVPLAPETQPLTATYWGPGRFYEWQRGSMGLSNLPAEFQTFADHVIDPQTGRYMAYVDDQIVGHDRIPEDANEREQLLLPSGRPRDFDVERVWSHIEPVLESCARNKYCQSAAKTVLIAARSAVLGVVVGPGTHNPLPSRIAALEATPAPTCRAELINFMGAARYCQGYAPELATALEPLTPLRTQSGEFIWSDVHQRAFDKAKAVLADAVQLSVPSGQVEWRVDTDYSSTANTGGWVVCFRPVDPARRSAGLSIDVLWPEQMKSTGWQIYSFGVKRFSTTVEPMHAARGELRTTFEAMRSCPELTYSLPTVGTDSKITYDRLNGAELAQGTDANEHRWLVEIASRMGRVEHVKATLADWISRNTDHIALSDDARAKSGVESKAMDRRIASRADSVSVNMTTRNGRRPACCPVCSRPDEAEDMAECDECRRWHHYSCIGYNPATDAAGKRLLCQDCQLSCEDDDDVAPSDVDPVGESAVHVARGASKKRARTPGANPGALERQHDISSADAGSEESLRTTKSTGHPTDETRSLRAHGSPQVGQRRPAGAKGQAAVAKPMLSQKEGLELQYDQPVIEQALADEDAQLLGSEPNPLGSQVDQTGTERDVEMRPLAQLLTEPDYREQWVEAVLADDTLKSAQSAAIRKQMQPGFVPFVDDETGLLFVVPDDTEKTVVAVPRPFRTGLIAQAHAHIGHQGIPATLAQCKKHYWWPSLTTDVRAAVSRCQVCTILKRTHTRSRLGPDQREHLARNVWIGIDVANINGQAYLTVTDAATTYTWCTELDNHKEESLLEAYLRLTIPHGASPAYITADNEFCRTALLKNFFASQGSILLGTPPNDPHPRAFLERVHRDWQDTWAHLHLQFGDRVPAHRLAHIALAAVNDAGDPSAYRRYFGADQRTPMDARLRTDLAVQVVHKDEWSESDWVLAAVSAAAEFEQTKRVAKRSENERNRNNRLAQGPSFRVGDRVRRWSRHKEGKRNIWHTGNLIEAVSDSGLSCTLRLPNGSVEENVTTRILDRDQAPLPVSIFADGDDDVPNSGRPMPWTDASAFHPNMAEEIFGLLPPGYKTTATARLGKLAKKAQKEASQSVVSPAEQAEDLKEQISALSKRLAKQEQNLKNNQKLMTEREQELAEFKGPWPARNVIQCAFRQNEKRVLACKKDVVNLKRRIDACVLELSTIQGDQELSDPRVPVHSKRARRAPRQSDFSETE